MAEREEHSAQHTDIHDLSRRWLMFVFWGLVVCLLAGVRFLSFSGLKGPNSGPPRVVVSVDDSRGSLWFRRRFRRTSARLCCGGPLSDTGVTYRAVSLALPRAFNREIQKKERARRQEGKRARGQEGKKAKGEEKM